MKEAIVFLVKGIIVYSIVVPSIERICDCAEKCCSIISESKRDKSAKLR